MILDQLSANRLKMAFLVLNAFVATCCSSGEMLQPEQFGLRNDVDIAVYTVDGRRIVFFKGEYEILRENQSNVIRGNGIINSDGNNILNKPFRGELQQTSVAHIEILDRSISKGLFGTAALVLAVLVLILILWPPRFSVGLGPWK